MLFLGHYFAELDSNFLTNHHKDDVYTITYLKNLSKCRAVYSCERFNGEFIKAIMKLRNIGTSNLVFMKKIRIWNFPIQNL